MGQNTGGGWCYASVIPYPLHNKPCFCEAIKTRCHNFLPPVCKHCHVWFCLTRLNLVFCCWKAAMLFLNHLRVTIKFSSYSKLRKSFDTVGVQSFSGVKWSLCTSESTDFVRPVGVLRLLAAGEECFLLRGCPVLSWAIPVESRETAVEVCWTLK